MKMLARAVPALFVTGALALCTAVLNGQSKKAPVVSNSQTPVMAEAVPDPTMPGVAEVRWEFKDGAIMVCGVTQDKGTVNVVHHNSIQYTKLIDGSYQFLDIHKGGQENVHIKGRDVYEIERSGKEVKLSGGLVVQILEIFDEQRYKCSELIDISRTTYLPILKKLDLLPLKSDYRMEPEVPGIKSVTFITAAP